MSDDANTNLALHRERGQAVAASPHVSGNLHNMLDRKTPERMTQQQELFVREYLIDLNATQAWIRAGGLPRNADKVAAKMMRDGSLVKTAVARALAERSARTGITADRVLRELGRLAFGDTRVLFRDDGSLKPPSEYNEDDGAMIEGVKTRKIVETGDDGKMVQAEIQEVKLASKTVALGMIMRHLGMNNDKLDVNVTPLAQSLNDAFKRVGRERADPDGGEVIDADYEEVHDGASIGFERPVDDELAQMLK